MAKRGLLTTVSRRENEFMYDKYDNGRGTAKHLLKHYLNLCFEKATGRELDSDCDVEIEGIIDAIFDGVKRELQSPKGE